MQQSAPPTPAITSQQAPPTPATATQPPPSMTSQPSRLFVSPFARTVAKERGIDLSTVNLQGSGTFGSIVSGDLVSAAMPVVQPSQPGDYEDTPHSQTRKVKDYS